jgi:hypothetical protein
MKAFGYVAVLCATWIAIAAPSARAEGSLQDASTGGAQQPSPTALALTRRYFAAVNFRSSMDSTMRSIMPTLIGELASEHPEITPAQRQIVTEAVEDSMPAYTDHVIEQVIPIYATAFSEQELTDIVTFYESPAGKAIVSKMPALAPRVAAILPTVLPEFKADIERRICSKIACPRRGPSNLTS